MFYCNLFNYYSNRKFSKTEKMKFIVSEFPINYTCKQNVDNHSNCIMCNVTVEGLETCKQFCYVLIDGSISEHDLIYCFGIPTNVYFEFCKRIRSLKLKYPQSNVKINCPFHDDKHPSAILNVKQKSIYCFAEKKMYFEKDHFFIFKQILE